MARLRVALALSAGVLAWIGACTAPAARAAARTLVVEAGKQARACVPMGIALPEGATKAKLTDQASGKEVPCQVADGQLWWILDELAAGATKTYAVELGADSSGDPSAVSLKQAGTKIDITIDGQPFTSYHFGEKMDWGKELWRPCFFPVLGPDQAPMTRAYPLVKDPPKNLSLDHPHHTSIWVAHGEVNGVNDWAIGEKCGRQLHKGFDAVVSGPVVGLFREQLEWTTPDRKPIMAEVRTARVYHLPNTGRMLDLEVKFQARSGKVVFGDTKEGGICSARMREELNAEPKFGKEGQLVNAQGLSGGAAWGKRSEWVDCSGLVYGRRLGFAIFDTPGNLRHPTYWHARTYGLLTANPFGVKCFDKAAQDGGFTLEDGKELTLRYRLYFHVGGAKDAKVAERYTDYAEPPKAEWR